jgi:hypoxanthine phosphoribosyltransferase
MPPGFNPLEPTGPTPGEFLELEWEMFGELCRALALRVARDYQPDIVVGIARAGVIPGAVIASILQCDFHSMLISRKAGAEVVRDRPAVLSAAPSDAMDRRVLLVDEITTTGDTFRLGLAAVRDAHAAEIRTAAMFARPRGYTPDFFALQTDATLIFPWDRKLMDHGDFQVNPRYRGALEE